MKILHLVSGELSGGAAKGAYNLHLALKAQNIESSILTNAKDNYKDSSIIKLSQNTQQKLISKALNILDNAPLYLYKKRLHRIFSNNFFGHNVLHTKAYKEADIIHLHWINGALLSLHALANIKKPIVWTLRDMWAMSGGCHYPIADIDIESMQKIPLKFCDGYQKQCGYCVNLGSQHKYDLSYLNLKRKAAAYPKNMQLIALSYFMYQCAKQSTLFKDSAISIIPNCIDTDAFSPLSKAHARQILKLPSDKKIILCGANAIDDFYKGFAQFIESLAYIDKEKYVLCFFGHCDKSLLQHLGFATYHFGYHNSHIALRILYNATDVFVAPSLIESFGKTIAESLSCGTPVVAFDYSATRDIITHKRDGYLAKSFQSRDLARGIDFICHSDSAAYQALSHHARYKAQKYFHPEVVAKAHIALYQSLLDGKLTGGGDSKDSITLIYYLISSEGFNSRVFIKERKKALDSINRDSSVALLIKYDKNANSLAFLNLENDKTLDSINPFYHTSYYHFATSCHTIFYHTTPSCHAERSEVSHKNKIDILRVSHTRHNNKTPMCFTKHNQNAESQAQKIIKTKATQVENEKSEVALCVA